MSWSRQAKTSFSPAPAFNARSALCKRWLDCVTPKRSRKKSKSVGAFGILGKAGSSPIIGERALRNGLEAGEIFQGAHGGERGFDGDSLRPRRRFSFARRV